jgi:hypothetical protein
VDSKLTGVISTPVPAVQAKLEIDWFVTRVGVLWSAKRKVSIFFYDHLATRCCKARLVAARVCWFAVSLCGKV